MCEKIDSVCDARAEQELAPSNIVKLIVEKMLEKKFDISSLDYLKEVLTSNTFEAFLRGSILGEKQGLLVRIKVALGTIE